MLIGGGRTLNLRHTSSLSGDQYKSDDLPIDLYELLARFCPHLTHVVLARHLHTCHSTILYCCGCGITLDRNTNRKIWERIDAHGLRTKLLKD